MGIRFEWYNPDKTVMRYVFEGDWNWLDYHRVVRVSVFQMMSLPERSVHSLLDMRAVGVGRFPFGTMAHARTFGKRHMPALSGHAVVLAMPLHIVQTLPLSGRVLRGQDGDVHFIDHEDELLSVLQAWA